MTHDEWMDRCRFLERSIVSLRGHMRSGRNCLAVKLKYKEKIKAREEELRRHKLDYFSLVF